MYNCCKNKVSFRVFRQALLKTMYDQVGQNLWCFLVPRQIVKSAGYYDLARVLELRFMGKYVLEFIIYFLMQRWPLTWLKMLSGVDARIESVRNKILS